MLAHLDDSALSEMRKQEVSEALENKVFSGEENESMVRRALADFKHNKFEFTDSWEINGKAFTYHTCGASSCRLGNPAVRFRQSTTDADAPPAGGKS